MQKNTRSSLRVHEWAAVVFFVGSFLLITIITQSQESVVAQSRHTLPSPTIDVIVRGAVKNPGVYKIRPMLTLGEFFSICEPCPDADLRKYKMTNLIKKGTKYYIHPRKVLHIHVSGAVRNPGTIHVFPGTRYYDLVDKIQLLENADSSIFKRRGLLKDNQDIVIPIRK